MPVLSSTICHGILNLPGANFASKSTVEELLKTDKECHHCYYHHTGMHNHLSHHILTAYDLGAPDTVIKAIYDEQAKMQRPVDLKINGVAPEGAPYPGEIMEANWTKWLGDAKAYAAYVKFFTVQVANKGSISALEHYIFSPAANSNGSHMLLRLFGGAFHPFIHIGCGLEFDNEIQVVAGLAQTAIHESLPSMYIAPENFVDATSESSVNKMRPVENGRQPEIGPSILAILRQIYDSPKLTPVPPYKPDPLLCVRLNDLLDSEGGSRVAELHRIMVQFDPGNTHEALDSRVEELMFVATLITFGTGKPHRKPRLDFFLVHLLTASLFVPSFLTHIPKLETNRALLRTFIQFWGTLLMTRGRPRIDPALLMSYTDNPLPPDTPLPKSHTSSLGGEDANSWSAIIADAIHAPEAHVVKALRALLYGATRYGTLPRGGVIGAWGPDGKETHPGICEVDGTIFVRAAGILMDTLGWVTHGQKAGAWDRSALGWDDAWKGEG